MRYQPRFSQADISVMAGALGENLLPRYAHYLSLLATYNAAFDTGSSENLGLVASLVEEIHTVESALYATRARAVLALAAPSPARERAQAGKRSRLLEEWEPPKPPIRRSKFLALLINHLLREYTSGVEAHRLRMLKRTLRT
ncbi:MAG: hypothetical protein EON54_03445 [Alcaligenaceae bacterium]|nr:MAG: hypothetical protein EON54_03445 [Alcaligenaceae bacterium]